MAADGDRSVRASQRAAFAGSALVVAGLVLMFLGVGRAFVTEVGRPWDVSFGGPTRGPRTGTIVHEDGRTESFQADDGDGGRLLRTGESSPAPERLTADRCSNRRSGTRTPRPGR